LHHEPDILKALIKNPDSNIIIRDEYTKPIIDIILQCPKEHGGMGGMIGLKYEALKDYVEWNTPDGYCHKQMQKMYIPTLLSYGQIYASFVNEKE